MNAIVVGQAAAGRRVIRPVPATAPAPGEVTIRVTAISLNRGETKRAFTSTLTGTRPGWEHDFAVRFGGNVDVDVAVGVWPWAGWCRALSAQARATCASG